MKLRNWKSGYSTGVRLLTDAEVVIVKGIAKEFGTYKDYAASLNLTFWQFKNIVAQEQRVPIELLSLWGLTGEAKVTRPTPRKKRPDYLRRMEAAGLITRP